MSVKKRFAAVRRVLWVFIPAVLVLAVGVGGLDFYLVHRLTHPQRQQLYNSPRDFQIILQTPMWFDESWRNMDGTQSVGWLLSRGKPGPAVILSHGYSGNRSDLLTLGVELWKGGYHVLLYDLRGHGDSAVKWSGLGTYENDDLLSAIKFLKNKKAEGGQPLVDGRVGLYGVDVGGYTSLVASSQDPLVKAVAVDSVHPDVSTFINIQMKEMVGTNNSTAINLVDSPWTSRLTRLTAQLYLMRTDDTAPALDSVSAASGRRFLFVTAKGIGGYDATTRQLYNATRDPKELVEAEHSRLERLYTKQGADYDARIVAFFRDAMPPPPDKPEKPEKKTFTTKPR